MYPYMAPPYQQQYPQMGMPQMGMPQAQQTNNIIKVNGPTSALQYPVAPNTQSPALFDTNGGIFYIVTADGAGSKTLESFDYWKHVDKEPEVPVSRQEFDALVAQVNEMRGTQDGIHGPVQPTAAANAPAANAPAANAPAIAAGNANAGQQIQ